MTEHLSDEKLAELEALKLPCSFCDAPSGRIFVGVRRGTICSACANRILHLSIDHLDEGGVRSPSDSCDFCARTGWHGLEWLFNDRPEHEPEICNRCCKAAAS